MERSVHDSLCVVKRVMESKNVVVGGGAVEAALSIYLENFATTLSSRYISLKYLAALAPCEGQKNSPSPCTAAGPISWLYQFFTLLWFNHFREQLAIADFAKSLLVIPKTLAVNAAQDASDLVAKLRAYHNSSQTKTEHAALKNHGLDLHEVIHNSSMYKKSKLVLRLF